MVRYHPGSPHNTSKFNYLPDGTVFVRMKCYTCEDPISRIGGFRHRNCETYAYCHLSRYNTGAAIGWATREKCIGRHGKSHESFRRHHLPRRSKLLPLVPRKTRLDAAKYTKPELDRVCEVIEELVTGVPNEGEKTARTPCDCYAGCRSRKRRALRHRDQWQGHLYWLNCWGGKEVVGRSIWRMQPC